MGYWRWFCSPLPGALIVTQKSGGHRYRWTYNLVPHLAPSLVVAERVGARGSNSETDTLSLSGRGDYSEYFHGLISPVARQAFLPSPANGSGVGGEGAQAQRRAPPLVSLRPRSLIICWPPLDLRSSAELWETLSRGVRRLGRGTRGARAATGYPADNVDRHTC